jgi:hypothetical protein
MGSFLPGGGDRAKLLPEYLEATGKKRLRLVVRRKE